MPKVLVFVVVYMLAMWLLPYKIARIISKIARIGSIILIILANGWAALIVSHVWLVPVIVPYWVLVILTSIVALIWMSSVGWFIIWAHRKYVLSEKQSSKASKE